MAGVMLVEVESGRKRILSPLCFLFRKFLLLSWAVLVVQVLPEQLFSCARLQKENFQYSSVPVFTGSDKDSPFHACALPGSSQKMCTLCCSGSCLPEESQDHEGKLLLLPKNPTHLVAVTFSCVRSCLNYSIGLQVWAVSQFKQEAEEFLWAWNVLIFEFHYTREWQKSGACRECNNSPTACEHHLVHCGWRGRSTKNLNWWKVFHLLGKVELYFISNLHFTTCDFELCWPFYACFS